MTALTAERATRAQDVGFTHFHEPLPLENAVKAYKGGLAGLYISGGTAGEVAPFKSVDTMIGIGRFIETVDNTGDGKLVKVEAGCFVWANAAGGDAIALGDIGKYAYGIDDQTVGIKAQTDTSDPVINTITPTAANNTQYVLSIRYKKPDEDLWKETSIQMVSDASGTATEICDGLRTSLVANDDLAGVITGTGTSTLILTGAEGVQFETEDAGTGVLAVVVTDAGTLTLRGRAGIIMDLTANGPAVLSHPVAGLRLL